MSRASGPKLSSASGPQAAPNGSRRALLGLAALAGAGALDLRGVLAPARAAEVPLLSLRDAARRLADGGHVLLMRHALTEPGVGDPPGYRLDDCATQRNLSQQGRAQARDTGLALRRAGVPIGAVRSSAWCRCRDTAQLVFGEHTIWPPLNSFFDARDAQAAHTQPVLALVLAHRDASNAVLVTHQVNITAASGVYPAPGQLVALRTRAGMVEAVFSFNPLPLP